MVSPTTVRTTVFPCLERRSWTRLFGVSRGFSELSIKKYFEFRDKSPKAVKEFSLKKVTIKTPHFVSPHEKKRLALLCFPSAEKNM